MSIGILIADDHAVFRSGLRALLEQEQEEEFVVVGEAESGSQALQAAADPNVDLLILDIAMPGMPTAKVAEKLLAKRPDIAIVVLTMHEDEYYLREFLKIGVKGFVLKKSTGRELVQAIRAAMRGQHYIDPALTGEVIDAYVGRTTKKGPARTGLLTPREREVCRLLALGHTNNEMAEKLFISARTVESHRASIMSKLELRSRADLVRFAIDNGLMDRGSSVVSPQ